MTSSDFITYLFCSVDDKLDQATKNHRHKPAKLYSSEVVTLSFLLVPNQGRGQS